MPLLLKAPDTESAPIFKQHMLFTTIDFTAVETELA